MKLLILIPSNYSLDKTIKLGFERNNIQVECFDFRKTISYNFTKIYTHRNILIKSISNFIESEYFKKINKSHIKKFEKFNPDIVIIYNNEILLPETLEYFKNSSKIVFYLGDNPLYTPTSNLNFKILEYADLIISPDSFWKKQLEILGIKNIIVDYQGYNPNIFYPYKIDFKKETKYSDMFFVGGIYSNTWGYKRALFLSKFSNLDFTIYGNKKRWKKWFQYFPELEDNFIALDKFMSFEDLNHLSNCSKVYPVDRNPGLQEGIHIRVFDCIGSGILPLVEYGKDINQVFKNVNIPIINNYSEAESLAKYYVQKDTERENLVTSLQQFVSENYMPWHFAKRILDQL